jgi:hypothetical protein
MLYCCFIAVLQLLYSNNSFSEACATGVFVFDTGLLFYCCFTSALLLVYCCFTAVLQLLYSNNSFSQAYATGVFFFDTGRPAIEKQRICTLHPDDYRGVKT